MKRCRKERTVLREITISFFTSLLFGPVDWAVSKATNGYVGYLPDCVDTLSRGISSPVGSFQKHGRPSPIVRIIQGIVASTPA